eukprot:scaffold99975_cov59-Phaeocystis_antarctica.AAC.2
MCPAPRLLAHVCGGQLGVTAGARMEDDMKKKGVNSGRARKILGSFLVAPPGDKAHRVRHGLDARAARCLVLRSVAGSQKASAVAASAARLAGIPTKPFTSGAFVSVSTGLGMAAVPPPFRLACPARLVVI